MSLFYCVVLILIYNGHLSLSEIINCNTGENCVQTCGPGTGPSACENDQIICPSNYECTVNCNGVFACAETTINAAESSNLEINCSGPFDDYTCSNIAVYCPQNNQGTKKCTITAGDNLFGDAMYTAHSLVFYAVNGWHDLDVIYSGNGIFGKLNEQTMYCSDNYDISCQIPVGSWTCDNTGDLTCNNPPTSTTTLDPTTMNPTSMTPTTTNPTTLAPTSMNPTTMTPTYMTPTTTNPTFMTPTTLNPTTLAPTSMTPTYMTPTTLNPTTIAPTTMKPTYMTPTTSNPTTSAPTIMAISTISNLTTLAPTSMKPTTSNPTNVVNEYEGNGAVTDALSTILDVNDYAMEGNKSFIDNYLWILYVFVAFIFILVVFIIFVVWKRIQRKREKIRSEGNMGKSQRNTIDTVTVEGDEGNIVMYSQAIGQLQLVTIASKSASVSDDIDDMYIVTKTKGCDTTKADGDCDNDIDDMYDNKPTSGSETMGNIVTTGNV